MDLHAKQLREEFWRNDALKGSPIGKPYKEIEFLSESSEEAGREVCNKKLQDMLNYAVAHCPYYQSFRGGISLS